MGRGSARRLNEFEQFEDLVRAAANYHRLLPGLVFKDYWVTRVLQAIATDPNHEGRILFKGGTSLSKGWNLIGRFSEDIDLLLTGPNFGPMPSGRAECRKWLKALQERIEKETPLRLPDLKAMSLEEARFFYLRGELNLNLRYPLPGQEVQVRGPAAGWLLVESGYRGDPHPHVRRPLRSLIAEFLESEPAARAALGEFEADVAVFEMEILKPERTFAEKLLALHVDMACGVEGAARVRTRHYYDVAQLLVKSEDVQKCLAGGGLRDLVRAAALVSNTFWKTKLDPETLDLRESPALAPTADQIAVLRANYESPNEQSLYFRDPVPFLEILGRLERLRADLTEGAWR